MRIATREHPAAEGGTVGEKCPVILPKCLFHVTFRDLLHAVELQHGTGGFTSPPKEGVLRIFFALKIRRLRPGVNLRTWVPKASTLPVVHRSRYNGKVSLTVRGKCGEVLSMGLIFLPSVLRPHPHPGQVVCQCRWQHAVIYVKSTNITIVQVIPTKSPA